MKVSFFKTNSYLYCTDEETSISIKIGQVCLSVQSVGSSVVCSNIPSYMCENSETESEPEQYAYKWSERVEEERSNSAINAIKRQMMDSLLQNATLAENVQFLYGDQTKEPVDQLIDCEGYIETLQRLNKLYSVQNIIWPFILQGQTTILLGNTDYYPHLLYMPPILSLIKVVHDLIETVFTVILFTNKTEYRLF